MNKWKKSILMAAAMLVPLFCTADARAATEEVVYDGVFIENADLSGMNEAEVRAAIDELILQRGQDEITLHMNGHTYTTNAQALGYGWTNEGVVKEALEYGKRGNVISRYKQKKDLEQSAVVLTLEGAVDNAAVQSVLEENCTVFNQEAQDHAIKVENGNIVQVPGVIGVALDVSGSVGEISRFMNEEWKGGEADIDLSVTTVEPGGDVEMLSKITDKLGEGSTVYCSSSKNRKTNVENAVSKINGTILYPGESFSVLDAVLPFEEDNGYATAASYSQGEVVESVGGGVCQVSSTLYLALIRAELKIDQRYAHSMLVTYVKPAFDAAVAEGSKDLKFTNDTDAPIYIYGTADGYSVAFTVFGMDTRDPNREISFSSETVEDSNPKVELNARLWKYVTEDGKTEKVAVNHSVYYKSNKEVEREKAQEAARAVEDKIAAIGDVTLDDAGAIAAAEAAFAALSEEAKDMVENADKLQSAKSTIERLKQEAAAPAVPEQPSPEQPSSEQPSPEQPSPEQPAPVQPSA